MKNTVVKLILLSFILVIPTTLAFSNGHKVTPTTSPKFTISFNASELNQPKLFLLPADQEFKDLKITHHRYQEESSDKPYMTFYPQSKFNSYTNNNIISNIIYDQPYQYELLKKGNLDILKVFVPVTYYSSSYKYTTTSISFQIQTTPKEKDLVPQKDLTNIRPLISNPALLDGFETQYDPQAPNYEYVIITNETLWDTFNTNFKSWKISNDYKINDIFIINISSILANSSYWVNGTYGDGTNESNGNPFIPDGKELTSNWSMFNDTQAKIRNFLRAYYTNNATRYVLLGGGFETVPVRYVSTHASGDGCVTFDSDLNHSSDMYYSNLHYNMNNDTNSYWMLNPCCDMTFDLIDWGIELYVGRVPVTTVAELNYWINKTKAYTNGNNQGNYLSRNIVAARDNGNAITNAPWYNLGGEYSASLGDEFASNQTFVDNQNISAANWSLINDFCNGAISGWDGISILLPSGHGSQCGGLFWNEYQPSTLNNTNTPNFVYSESCFVGEFGDASSCCVKSWMKDQNCTFAAIANSAYGWFGASTYFIEEMMRQMFNDSFGAHNMTFCAAHATARELQGYSTADGVWAMIFKETNFMGDPALDWVWYNPQSSTTLFVGGSGPNNYTTINQAYENSSSGNTIYVYGGTYYENLSILQTITLKGENRSNTTIDGCEADDVIYIGFAAPSVNISGFKIQNASNGHSGIDINNDYINIYDCIFTDNDRGILLQLWPDHCTIHDNVFYKNGIGISIDSCSDNIVYQNNFFNNSANAYNTPGFTNAWDYNSQGNYWDDYKGTDIYETGIGSTPYDILGAMQDDYPLMFLHNYTIPFYLSISNYSNETTHNYHLVFNWTASDAAYYELVVANDSSFTDIYYTISNINEFTYPSYFSVNSTRIEFILPSEYDLDYKTYYTRVRAYASEEVVR